MLRSITKLSLVSGKGCFQYQCLGHQWRFSEETRSAPYAHLGRTDPIDCETITSLAAGWSWILGWVGREIWKIVDSIIYGSGQLMGWVCLGSLQSASWSKSRNSCTTIICATYSNNITCKVLLQGCEAKWAAKDKSTLQWHAVINSLPNGPTKKTP